jgi:hypothetical protein
MKVVWLPAWIVVVFVFVFSPEMLAQKMEIRLFLNKDAHYIYAITLENRLEQEANPQKNLDQTMTLKIDHHVIDRMNNGNYLVEASYKSFSLIMKNNQRVSTYYSDTVDVMNPYYKQLKFLTELKLSYEVSPEGAVSNLKGFENMKKHIDSDIRLANLLRSFGSELVINEMYNYIPMRPVQLNETWKAQAVLPDLMDLKYDLHYTLKEVSEKNLKIEQKAEFNFKPEEPISASGTNYRIEEAGTQNGELLINPKSGMRMSSKVDQVINITLTPKNPKSTNEKGDMMKLFTRQSIRQVR